MITFILYFEARPSNKCSVPKGKAMGGTTAINGLIYSRGHKTDYERWAQEGNSGWSFAEVLPYFIKSENSEIDGDPGYHGKGGYMNVMYHRPHSDRCEAFLKGNRELFPILNGKDYNGKQEFGAFYSQFNKIKKFRQSSSKAFLEPIMDRPNLKILNGSYVTKILIDPRTKTAYGVTFTKDGKCFTANASKEVILSAGVINSPQILMLSGVGPRPHLSKLKIPVIQDLPVGKSLYQHSLFYGAFMNTNSTAPVQSLRESVKQFLDDYGPLTIPANNEGVGFYRTLSERSNSPDVELAINPSGEFYIFEQASRYTDEVRHALFDKLNRNTFIHTYIYLLKPESVGSITLESSDPFKYPLIDSNCLNKTKDIKVLLTGIRILERLMYTKPFRKINATMVYADYPQCKKYPLGSNNYWVCALKLLTDPGAHQMCSCRMGPNPNTSVVGSRGNVHGIKRLRVVDASIIPFSVAGHPAAPIFMLAEKISDYIKLDYGKPIDPITNVID